MRLRFQLPQWGRPFTVDRAVLHMRIRAPGRKVSVFGLADGQPVAVQDQSGPAGPMTVEVTDPKLLRADPDGGLFLELVISERLGADGRERPIGRNEELLFWEIETLGLEVVGHGSGK
jgi:hypothetical protein